MNKSAAARVRRSSTRRWRSTSRPSGAGRASRCGWSRPAATNNFSSTSRAMSRHRPRDGPRAIPRAARPSRSVPCSSGPAHAVPQAVAVVALAVGACWSGFCSARPGVNRTAPTADRRPRRPPAPAGGRLVRGRDRRGRAELHPRLRADRHATSCRSRCTAAGRCSTPTATAGWTSSCCKGRARTPGCGNRLYLQTPDGKFRDASAGSGLDFDGCNVGVAVGDVDNDGRPDVLDHPVHRGAVVPQRGRREVPGHHRPRPGSSTRTGARRPRSSITTGTAGSTWSIVNYLDYDQSWPCNGTDGSREFCGPRTFPGTIPRLFHNLGPGDGKPVRFADVTVPAGLATKAAPGLGVYARRLDGRRLAGHADRQRRHAEPPVGEPAGRRRSRTRPCPAASR